MKTTLSALLALLLLFAPLAGLAAGQEDLRDDLPSERELQVEVLQGATDRFGGGEWVAIKVGQTIFAVMYGNETNPNAPKAFVEYDRYLGKFEVYNETEELLAEGPIPVYTVMAQSFELMVEFRDGDDDGLLHFPDDWRDLLFDQYDYPRKVLNLNTAWTLEDLIEETSDDGSVTTVDFNITARDLPYDLIRPNEDIGDGVLNEITLAFHLTVDRVVKDVDFDIYTIVVNETDHSLVSVNKTGTETVTAVAVNGTFKYDHYIEGWDWGGEDSRLALGTHVFAGNILGERFARIVKLAFAHRAVTDSTEYRDTTHIDRPINVSTVDQMVFDDEWTRIGRLVWSSDVLVDGEEDTMSFQVHRVWKGMHLFPRGLVRGFAVGGAFIYPQGEVIFHDPGLAAGTAIPIAADGGGPLGLGPYFVQAAVAGVVVVGLLVFRTLRRKPQ